MQIRFESVNLDNVGSNGKYQLAHSIYASTYLRTQDFGCVADTSDDA